jgi:hypothetical protein
MHRKRHKGLGEHQYSFHQLSNMTILANRQSYNEIEKIRDEIKRFSNNDFYPCMTKHSRVIGALAAVRRA